MRVGTHHQKVIMEVMGLTLVNSVEVALEVVVVQEQQVIMEVVVQQLILEVMVA